MKINKQTNNKLLTRRSFYLLGSLFYISSFFLKFDIANAKSSRIKKAELLSKKIFNELFTIISKNSNENSKKKSLLKLFDRYADVPIIARAVLGSPWRQLNQNERSSFINAFRKYLAKKYTAQFSEFLGAEMLIEKSRIQVVKQELW